MRQAKCGMVQGDARGVAEQIDRGGWGRTPGLTLAR
jgi:hypothetical protein